MALEHLALLAKATRTAIGGENAAAMATAYVAEGWRADAAALDALAVVAKAPDIAAVIGVVRAVYMPWLEAGANRFQERLRIQLAEAHTYPTQDLAQLPPGTCILFADGLRLDVSKRLHAALEASGLLVEDSWRWAPLPPVTPTAKPVASPVAHLVSGDGAGGEQFRPFVRETGQPLTIDRFRKLLTERGFQDLRGDDSGDPTGRGWTEHGQIDPRGHAEGWKLAKRIAEEVHSLVDRIRGLVDAGWREVRVVTDHGWLLMPGGLPKVDMPQYLVESRWTRCATLKPGANVDHATVPWYWNADVQVVMAPGIGSFRAGVDYSHGSLSLQECVVPSLTVRPARPSGPAASLTAVRWTGLRCRVQAAGAGPGWQVDLRTKAGDAASSLAPGGQPRPLGAGGEAAILVDNPDHEGVAAVVVLLDAAGLVVARYNTTLGDEA
ncbi:MAG: BREX-1 system phosphatase PglZ type B [Ardenticatenia bacterium]|nr:BREX-1 system phosphatase PglZ type B [Ardenticatenia bacterium]